MGIKENSDTSGQQLEERADLMGKLSIFLEVLGVGGVQILGQHHPAVATIIS
jgi:hypothetical protein